MGGPSVRIRSASALVAAGVLGATGVAAAQDTSVEPPSTTTRAAPAVTTAGELDQPAPISLGFAGGDPLAFLIAGLVLVVGGGAVLVRERGRG
jgi:hypothetical protein